MACRFIEENEFAQAGAELCQAHSCEAGVLNELKTKVEVEVELGYIVED